MPKISVMDKVLAILKTKVWVGSDEIEALFPKGEPGHFSWAQRLRGLRDKGFTIDRRIKKGTKNLSEWHLVLTSSAAIPSYTTNDVEVPISTPRQAYEKNGQLGFL